MTFSMQGYRLYARPMPLRPAGTINPSRCTKATSTAGRRTPDLLSHHCSANGSSDGNSLAATPRSPRSSLTLQRRLCPTRRSCANVWHRFFMPLRTGRLLRSTVWELCLPSRGRYGDQRTLNGAILAFGGKPTEIGRTYRTRRSENWRRLLWTC
jgi:hypothetical protein